MNILLVSSSVLPQTGGSSVIIENLAQNFLRNELTVFGSSTWKLKKVPSRNPSGPEFIYFFSEIYFMGRGNRYFRWFRKLRFKRLIKTIEKVIRTRHITHVIGVYPNIEYCLAACRAAKNLNIPFSSYFHNTYIENIGITDTSAEIWQQEVFDQSEHIFVMSKGMKSFYEAKYGLDKFKPLVHTFNAYPSQKSQTDLRGVSKEMHKLVAIGNFNESNLEATKRILAAIKDNPKYTLSLYTHVPKLLLEKRGLDSSCFEHKGAVEPHEVHNVIQDYDICLLTHGFTGGYGQVEYETIFPTRTIPLLLSGKPILAHSPKDSFLNRFIQENQCAHLVDQPEEEAIVSGLDKIVGDINYRQMLVARALETAKLFYGPDVSTALKQQLNKVDEINL